MLLNLDKELSSKDAYVPVPVREFLNAFERRRVYDVLQELFHGGLSMKGVHYVHHVGGNQPSLHFIWKVGEKDSEGELLNKCNQVIRSIESNIPFYERRIIKKHFMDAFGFIGNYAALRAIFKELTGDQSAPANLNQSEIDKRFTHSMLSEDPHIVVNYVNFRRTRREIRSKIFSEKRSDTYQKLAQPSKNDDIANSSIWQKLLV